MDRKNFNTSLNINNSEIKEIIEQGDMEKLNELGKKLGEYLASKKDGKPLSTSQIRNILDRVQRIKPTENIKSELQCLRPLLAYAAGRHGGKVKFLQHYLDYAIQLVGGDKDKFKNFKNFFEAIVAYHKFYGGKD